MLKQQKENWSYVALLVLTFVFSGWSYYIYKNNTYMAYTDVPVTFIDRYPRQSCVKSSCREVYEGLFKTDDGVVFDRPISGYMYHRMHLGEKFTLNLRRFDIRQTEKENIYWFFAPIIIWIVTAMLLIFSLSELCDRIIKRLKSRRKR